MTQVTGKGAKFRTSGAVGCDRLVTYAVVVLRSGV
jgi:hypothetical protein